MRAVVLEQQGQPLKSVTLPDPVPGAGQLLLQVQACGVCRTDLHLRDAEIKAGKLPVVLGHQIVGTTEDGRRVGVPWLGYTDGECRYCRSDRENLCVNARFTGSDIDGGYAELTVADERFCLPLPDELSAEQAAPLLCGGLIGYRALRFTGDAATLGPVRLRIGRPHDLPGGRPPGARGLRVHATRRRAHAGVRKEPGCHMGRRHRRGCPVQLDAAIIFAPAGELVPGALKLLAPGGTVVCAGIHMSDIPSFPYEDLWHERTIRSVANLTRRDGEEFIALAPKVPVRTTITKYPLEQAETALADLRAGRFEGTAVIVP